MSADTSPVYPPPDTPARGFFAPIPAETVMALAATRHLLSGDTLLLVALFSYKNRATTTVFPRQDTLARRIGRSLDTVQRGLARLTRAGLIVKHRRRDVRGRLASCWYDLAPTLALLTPQAAAVRSGQWGSRGADQGHEIEALKCTRWEARTPNVLRTRTERSGCPVLRPKDVWPQVTQREDFTPSSFSPAKPQTSGIPNGDSEDVAEADTGLRRAAGFGRIGSAETGPCADLIAQGVRAPVAARLAARYGDIRCRQVLAASHSRPAIRDRAAWLVSCLTQGWALTDSHVPEDRPRAYRPYPVPPKSGLPPPAVSAHPPVRSPSRQDPALEARARAELLAEAHPIVVQMLRRGRGWSFVRARMTQIQRE